MKQIDITSRAIQIYRETGARHPSGDPDLP
jgi:hypothetical protein